MAPGADGTRQVRGSQDREALGWGARWKRQGRQGQWHPGGPHCRRTDCGSALDRESPPVVAPESQ